ncbi:MAG: hypothetical protein OCD02_20765 [Spirochaetaceae bacterium]
MKKLGICIFFCILLNVAYTDDTSDWRLVDNKVIYNSDGNEYINLTANTKWIKLDNVVKPFVKDFPPPAPGYIRKWRIRSNYSDSDPSIKTSFQFKFMTSTFKKPLFNFTRPLGYNGMLEGFSGWFQFEDGSKDRIYNGDASLYARIISPPTTANTGKIFAIELQAWDKLSESAKTKTAAGRTLPGTNLFSKLSKKNKIKTKDQATDFAYQVMSTIFNKDSAEFIELLSDKCYSLENGTVYYKSNFPLYDNLKEITKDTYITLATYQDNYKPQLISYQEYSELFPHWIEENREWIPGENDFLFLGNMMKKTGKELLKTRMAVFMIGFDNGKWQIKAIPE